MTVLQSNLKSCAVADGMILIAVLVLGVIRMTVRVSGGSVYGDGKNHIAIDGSIGSARIEFA